MAIANDKNNCVQIIMYEIVYRLKSILGGNLRQVILFGSYARGQQVEYSDMDVMALVNLSDNELSRYNNVLTKVTADISIKYGVLPSIIDKNYEHFHHWVPFVPFYRNVLAEGVEFYSS
jgi:predicted nucleotidyltransferase